MRPDHCFHHPWYTRDSEKFVSDRTVRHFLILGNPRWKWHLIAPLAKYRLYFRDQSASIPRPWPSLRHHCWASPNCRSKAQWDGRAMFDLVSTIRNHVQTRHHLCESIRDAGPAPPRRSSQQRTHYYKTHQLRCSLGRGQSCNAPRRPSDTGPCSVPPSTPCRAQSVHLHNRVPTW